MATFPSMLYPRYQFMDGTPEQPPRSNEDLTNDPIAETAEEPTPFIPPGSQVTQSGNSNDAHDMDIQTTQITEKPPPDSFEEANDHTAQATNTPEAQRTRNLISFTRTVSSSSQTTASTSPSREPNNRDSTPDDEDWYPSIDPNSRLRDDEVADLSPQSPPRGIQIAQNKAEDTRTRGKKAMSKNWQKFRRWLHFVWLDLLVMKLALLVALLFNDYVQTYRYSQRFFPVVYNPLSEEWEGPIWLGYPRLNTSNKAASLASKFGITTSGFIIEPLFAGVILEIVGFAVLGLMQIWVRDAWDFTAAKLGMTKALVTVTLITALLKKFLGKMRPNFMDLCKLNFTSPETIGNQPSPYFNRQWATPEDCAGDKSDIRFGLEAFPSGHTASSFTVGIFLALYLNAKLKAFSNYHTSYWKMLVVVAPILGACFIAGSVFIDNNHSVEDIIYSIAIAEFVALMSYRAHYASVFGYKTNHMYLPFSSTHRSLDAKVPVPDTDAEADKPNFRFKRKNNGAAVAWPRKRGDVKPLDDKAEPTVAMTTPSSGGGAVAGMTAISGTGMGTIMAAGDGGPEVRTVESAAGGNDGTDERPTVTPSLRRRARYNISNDRIKHRRSMRRYSLSRGRAGKKSVDDLRYFGSDRNATIRPSRMRLLSRGSGRKSVREAKRSAGHMV